MKTKNNYINIQPTKTLPKFFILLAFLIYYGTNITMAQPSAQWNQFNTVLSANTNTSAQLFNNFETYAVEGNVYLKWYVKDKDNSKIYLIAQAEDGINYKTKGVLKTDGGKLDIIILNCFTDTNPAPGYSNYRLVAIDEFGDKEYSAVNTVYTDYIDTKVAKVLIVENKPFN
jgi:hypothetical protein